MIANGIQPRFDRPISTVPAASDAMPNRRQPRSPMRAVSGPARNACDTANSSPKQANDQPTMDGAQP